MQSDVPTLEADDEDEAADSSDAASSDGEPVVPLATGREKRINQGNRMRALLEEEGLIEDEELFREEADDVDFEAKDEEDVFDSDFGSTDSGSGAEDAGEDAGERQLIQDAKAERREARGKKKAVHTPFLPSFARQTKHPARRPPVASTSASTLDGTLDGPPPKKRKISLAAVNAIAGITPRESSRKSSVAFKKTIEVRLLENEQRRATLPKPVKKTTVSLTQGDLIAEALETEEINRASLLAFYAAEEDRRAADRIAGMRYEIFGPKLTFLSRLEGVPRPDKGKGVEGSAEADSAAAKLESGRRRLIEVIGEAGKAGWRPNMGMGDGPPGSAAAATPPLASTSALADSRFVPERAPVETDSPVNPPTANPLAPAVDVQSVQPLVATPSLGTGPLPSSALAPATSKSSAPSAAISTRHVSAHPPPHPLEAPATDAVDAPYARNYVILSEFEGNRQEEMAAIFGQHHEWGSVKVVPSRSRVLNRKIPLCPLTGLPAPYRDPRTMTPYSSLAAYRTLTALVDQSYSWDPTHGAFTGKSGWGLQKELEERQPSRGKARVPLAPGTVDNPYATSYNNAVRAPRNRGRGEGSPAALPSPPVTGPSTSAAHRPPSTFPPPPGATVTAAPMPAAARAKGKSKVTAPLTSIPTSSTAALAQNGPPTPPPPPPPATAPLNGANGVGSSVSSAVASS